MTTLTQVPSWLGGYEDDMKNWMWSDGSLWNFTNWATNQPDNAGGKENYLETNFRGEVLLWNDRPVNSTLTTGYICQYEIDGIIFTK